MGFDFLAQTQLTGKPTVTPWWLVVPCCFFLIPAVVSSWISIRYWERLKERLSFRRLYRASITLVPTALVIVLVPAFLDRAMVDDLRDGKIYEGYTTSLSIVMAGFWLFCWSQTVSYFLGDDAINQSRIDRLLLDEARRYSTVHLGIARSFLAVVTLKAERIAQLLQGLEDGRVRKNDVTAKALVSVLSPEKQKEALVAAVHSIYNNQVERGRSVRVTYYELDGRYLVPRMRHNGQLSKNLSKWFNICKDKLEINPVNPGSIQVQAALKHQIMIVPDAEAAHNDPTNGFCWLVSKEEDKLKSIVAIPLLIGEGREPARRLLTIDTDDLGFFGDTEEYRMQLSLLADNIVGRLSFEADMARLQKHL